MTGPIRYTREMLVGAAARCDDIDSVIAHLGVEDPPPRLASYLMRRFRAYGIDTSHFERRRPYRRHVEPDTATLRSAVASSISWAETLRRLELPSHHTWTASLKRWIEASDLDTSHFLGQAHQRVRPGTIRRRTAEEILVRHEGERRTATRLLRRALREIGVPDRCDGCGTPPEWHGRPMTLEVDHVNGDRSDDRPENLRLLCPNCHAITSTWCRGGRRKPVAD
ncbi:HNH endonuclease [Streptomyces sp. NPDC101733]|uniref:HNH endonuclease n=1 Tax=unclassified Streptomyces TaxID=2593676 RepID=UPI00381A1D5F